MYFLWFATLESSAKSESEPKKPTPRRWGIRLRIGSKALPSPPRVNRHAGKESEMKDPTTRGFVHTFLRPGGLLSAIGLRAGKQASFEMPPQIEPTIKLPEFIGIQWAGPDKRLRE
jgi:hypothetical protein